MHGGKISWVQGSGSRLQNSDIYFESYFSMTRVADSEKIESKIHVCMSESFTGYFLGPKLVLLFRK